MDDVAASEAIVGVALGGGNGMGTEGLLELDLALDFLRELGAKFDGVDGAILNAFAASDAVSDVDFAAIVGSNGFVGFEFLDGAQTKAGASTAVADGGGVAFTQALDGGDAVHQAFLFAVMEDLLDFLTGDLAVFARTDEELRRFAKLQATIVGKVAAAFTHFRAAGTARAFADGEVIVFV